MAFDLLFREEIDLDASRPVPEDLRSVLTPAQKPVAWSQAEIRKLKQLEVSTQTFAVDLISWAKSQGIPAALGLTVYTPEQSDAAWDKGKSGIEKGRLDWHNVGRAFHVIIAQPGRKLDFKDPVTRDAYYKLGERARQQGGTWFGDHPIKTRTGYVFDLAHFEYHPSLNIGPYRKSKLAETEFKSAQTRRRLYGG